MKEKLTNSKVTPVMRQYWNVKKSHPDSIMLFRMGDFYETFEEDAKITSKTLGIALTKRANGAASAVPLAGFPYHALEQHVYKLLNSGYKVALCEQVEDPKEAKGIVKRSVVEVLTPGTAISTKYLNTNDNNFIISLYFSNNNFGYSILDNSTGEFYCGNSQINNLREIINKYEVKEILISKEQEYIISDLLGNILITTYDNWKTDKATCYDKLIDHFGTKSLKGFGIENDSLCTVRQILEQTLPNTCHFATLSGPTFALEVARGVPSAIVAAADSYKQAERIQDIFSAQPSISDSEKTDKSIKTLN